MKRFVVAAIWRNAEILSRINVIKMIIEGNIELAKNKFISICKDELSSDYNMELNTLVSIEITDVSEIKDNKNMIDVSNLEFMDADDIARFVRAHRD